MDKHLKIKFLHIYVYIYRQTTYFGGSSYGHVMLLRTDGGGDDDVDVNECCVECADVVDDYYVVLK